MKELTPEQRAATQYIQGVVQEEVAKGMAPLRDSMQRVKANIDELQRTQRNVLIKVDDHDEALFGNSRIRGTGLADQIQQLSQQLTRLSDMGNIAVAAKETAKAAQETAQAAQATLRIIEAQQNEMIVLLNGNEKRGDIGIVRKVETMLKTIERWQLWIKIGVAVWLIVQVVLTALLIKALERVLF